MRLAPEKIGIAALLGGIALLGADDAPPSYKMELRFFRATTEQEADAEPAEAMEILQKLSEELKKKLPASGDAEGGLDALYRFLFREKRWKPLSREESDYPERLNLESVALNGEGAPESVILICRLLARRAGLDADVVAVPSGLFLRCGGAFLDLTAGEPAVRSLGEMRKRFPQAQEWEASGYLKPLSDDQQVAYLKFLRGRMLARRRDFRRAGQCLTEAQAALKLPDLAYESAALLGEEGKTAEAAARFRDLAGAAGPMQARSTLWLARLALAEGNAAQARERLDACAQLAAGDPWIGKKSAGLWLAMGEPERAYRACQDGLSQAPSDPELIRLSEAAQLARELRGSKTGKPRTGGALPPDRPSELIRGCASADPKVQKRCLDELRKLREPVLWKEIDSVLRTGDLSLRKMCVRLLPHFTKGAPLAAALSLALGDEDADVRAEAIDQAVKTRSLEARGDLSRVAQKDPEPTVRKAAIDALSQLTQNNAPSPR